MQPQADTVLRNTGQARASLPGTWVVNVAPKDAESRPPSVEVAAINSDGSLVNFDRAGRGGAGQWKRTNDGKYAVTFTGFYLEDEQSFRYKVRATLTLNANEDAYSGPFQTTISNPAGEEVLTYRGTVSATRVRIESPE